MRPAALFSWALIILAVVVGLQLVRRIEAPVFTVDQVIAQHELLDGRLIRVRGFLSACAAENCTIASMPRRPDQTLESWHDHGGRLLSIGPSYAVDEATANLHDHAGSIFGRFDQRCRTGQLFCVDRAAELRPSLFRPVNLVESH